MFFFSFFLGSNPAWQDTFLAGLQICSSLLSQPPSSHYGLWSFWLSLNTLYWSPLLLAPSSHVCFFFVCVCEKLQKELQDTNPVSSVPTHCVSPWKHVSRFLFKEIKAFKVVPNTSRSNESFHPMWIPFLINVFLFWNTLSSLSLCQSVWCPQSMWCRQSVFILFANEVSHGHIQETSSFSIIMGSNANFPTFLQLRFHLFSN